MKSPVLAAIAVVAIAAAAVGQDPVHDPLLRRWALELREGESEAAERAAAALALRFEGERHAALPYLALAATEERALPHVGRILRAAFPDGPAEALVLLLRSPDARIRVQSVRALGSLGRDAAPAVAGLIGVLDDDAVPVVASASAIGRIGPAAARAAPALHRAAESGNECVRAASARALAAIGSPQDVAVLLVSGVGGRSAMRALTSSGPELDAALVALARDDSARVRGHVARLLTRERADFEATHLAVAALARDPEAGVRGQLLRGLERTPQGLAYGDIVRSMIGDAELQGVALTTAERLGLDDEDTVLTVAALLRSKTGRVRHRAAAWLSRRAAKAAPARQQLLAALTTRESRIASYVCVALAAIGERHEPMVPPLLPRLHEARPRGWEPWRASPLLRERIPTPARPVRLMCGTVDFTHVSPRSARDALIILGDMAKPAVTRAFERAGGEDKVRLAYLLHQLGDVDPTALLPLLTNESETVRTFAAIAVVDLGDHRAAAAKALTDVVAQYGPELNRSEALGPAASALASLGADALDAIDAAETTTSSRRIPLRAVLAAIARCNPGSAARARALRARFE